MSEVVSEGQEVEIKVIEVDLDKKRVSLAMASFDSEANKANTQRRDRREPRDAPRTQWDESQGAPIRSAHFALFFIFFRFGYVKKIAFLI